MVVRFVVPGSDRPYYLTGFCPDTGEVEFSSFLDDAIQFTRLDVACVAMRNALRSDLEKGCVVDLWEPASE